jgi:hypothetical protein
MKLKNEHPRADEVRRDILTWLHNQRGAPRGKRQLCKGIKEVYGHKGPLVNEHLIYLIDLGYVTPVPEKSTIRTGRMLREYEKMTYRISAKGVEFMQGKSLFSDRDRYPGLNVGDGSIVIIGDGNIVNPHFRPLYDELGRLKQAVLDSSGVSDSQKCEGAVQLETIRCQLALPRPDQTIVQRAWETAQRICAAATLERIPPTRSAFGAW